VYEYFESKEAIILELVNTRAKQDYMKVFDVVEKLPTCKEQLSKYLQMQIETTAKYAVNVTDLRNEFARNESELSMKIIEAIHNIIFIHFEYVHNLIKKGIKTGEFKNLNPFSATLCFMGSINFYLGMLHTFSDYPEFGMFQEEAPVVDQNSLLECMFNGFLA